MTTSAPSRATAAARPNTGEMIVVHNVFRRMFGDLPKLIRAITPGDTGRAAVLADAVVEVTTGLHHHHTGEDELVWPLLSQRVETDGAFVLRAEEQHARIHELVELTNEQVAPFRAHASAEHRDALATTIEALNDAVCEHMADEERYILPLIEEHMTVAEWEALGERGRAGMPKDRLLVQLGWILDGVPADERREFLSKLPMPARVAWRMFGRRRWDKERRAIYGE